MYIICHPVSPIEKSSGYAKRFYDESKTEIFLMMSLTFENEIIFGSKGGAPSIVQNITATSVRTASVKRRGSKS